MPPAAQYVLSEAVLHSGAAVHRWEEKAGFSFLFEYESVPTPAAPPMRPSPASDVIDLTEKMKPDGSLDWDAPPGRGRAAPRLLAHRREESPRDARRLRLRSRQTQPRTHGGYYHGYFDPLAKALGPLFGKALRYVMMDSWEAGTNNWTDEMRRRIRKAARLRSDAVSARAHRAHRGERGRRATASSGIFAARSPICGPRRTTARWREKLRSAGIGIYAEAAGVSLEMPEDTLLNKSKVEIPMGEFWVRDLHPRLMYLQDVRGAASAAHVYGKPLVAAESFTGGGYESPFDA